MPLPSLLPVLSFEEILAALVTQTKELLPAYIPAQGDDVMLVLQSFAYREMLLRHYIQQQVEGNFLSTATGVKLDHLAETLYGLSRLEGARPTASAQFSLSTALAYPVTIPEDYQLTEDGGIYRAHTTRAGVIPAGETEITLPLELEEMTQSSTVHTEIPVTPLPYLSVAQTEAFAYGAAQESDEAFRARIRLSLADKSTAGSARTYQSYTYKADKRITDVQVTSPAPGQVKVVYYGEQMDTAMQQRVEQALNAEEVRPLTDQVIVQAAQSIQTDISGMILIQKGESPSAVYLEAQAQLSALFAAPKIGADVTVAALVSALMVPGVLDVLLDSPASNVGISPEQIAVPGAINLSYEVRDGL